MIFNILDNTTELWMTKYITGEIFSSGGATLYKNSSDQTVSTTYLEYSGRYFAFFKFCEMRNSNHNILREICEIAKSNLPYKISF